MGSKRKARSRAARRSPELDSPLSRIIDEEDMLVGRGHSSDTSAQSEKDKRQLTETSSHQSLSTIVRSNLTPQACVEFENTGNIPVPNPTGLMPVACNTLSQHTTGDVPVTCKSSCTPVSFTDVVQVHVPCSKNRVHEMFAPQAFKVNTQILNHLPSQHEVPVGDRPSPFLQSTRCPVTSPSAGVDSRLPGYLTRSNTNHFLTLSNAHSVPYNHSHSRPVTTSMHFQELPNSIRSEHTLNSSQSSFNANTVGQFSSMSTAHNTGYVPVTSHTDQFLSVSLPTVCTSCIPVISSTGSSHMGCLGNNPSFPSVQNVQDFTPISYPSGRSQNTATNYDTCHRFQSCQIPSSDVSQQNLDVRSFPDIAQLIKSEVEKAVKKLSTEYQQSKSADSQFQYRYQSASEPYSTESSDDEISAIVRNTQSRVKLPPFNGKEDWKIWYARFEETAERKRWNEKRKLDELLPRFHGVAAEFVYGQLSKSTRRSYKKLITELNNRFRVVETRKTYIAKFSNRQQKPGERVEDYAAELKNLYDKAHPKRDSETREEDLLRRFLDGLADGDAQFHVEYVKEPENIDEAVLQAVNFEETGRGQKHRQKIARQIKEQKPDAKSDAFKRFQKKETKNTSKLTEDQQRINELQEQLQNLSKELGLYKQQQATRGQTETTESRNKEQVTHQRQREPGDNINRQQNIICYCCKQNGHYARECPLRMPFHPNQRPVDGAPPLNGH